MIKNASQKLQSKQIRFELIQSDKWENVLAAWSRLAAKTNDEFDYFSKPIWAISWQRAYEAQNCYLLAGWQKDELVFALPLQTKNIYNTIRIAVPIGLPHSGYSVPLICPTQCQAELFDQALCFVRETTKTDALSLPSKPISTAWAQKAKAMRLANAGAFAAMIKLNDEHANAHSMRNKQLRRKWNQLSKFGDISLEHIKPSHPLFASMAGTSFQWKADWLNQQARTGQAVRNEEFEQFVTNLAATKPSQNDDTSDQPFFMALCVDDRAIASFLMLPNGNKLQCWFTAFAPDYSKFSPGLLLLGEILQWMGDTQWEVYDFIGFPEPFKLQYANHRVELIDEIYPLNTMGKIYGQLAKLRIRYRIKQLFYALPKSLRSRIIKA